MRIEQHFAEPSQADMDSNVLISLGLTHKLTSFQYAIFLWLLDIVTSPRRRRQRQDVEDVKKQHTPSGTRTRNLQIHKA